MAAAETGKLGFICKTKNVKHGCLLLS